MTTLMLTPGTGSFYCGSCVRDNALARAMRARGHNVLLVPMYLPHVVGEMQASEAAGQPLFFGGINVYLRHKTRVWRTLPRWITRMLDHPALLRLASRRAGMTAPAELAAITLSMLRCEDGPQRCELDRLIHFIRREADVRHIVLSNALLCGLARPLREALGLPILCTLQGEDAFLDSLGPDHSPAAWAALREAAAHVDCFTPVSSYYGELMTRRMELDPHRVRVLHNGVDPRAIPLGSDRRPPSPADGPPRAVRIGFLAHTRPEKGLHRLVDAFLELSRQPDPPPMVLDIAGTATAADRPYIRELQARIRTASRDGEVHWRINLPAADKTQFLHGIDLLCVPAEYGEAFGLYVLEALSAGRCVVVPRHAAFVELAQACPAVLLYDPQDPKGLASVLQSIVQDPARREALRPVARAAVEGPFSLDQMAADMLEILASVGPASAPAGAAPANLPLPTANR